MVLTALPKPPVPTLAKAFERFLGYSRDGVQPRC